MTNSHRRRRGMASQGIVAEAWRADGWPYAESVGTGVAGRDLTGTPGVAIEVKARTGLDLGAWLRQAVTQATDGEVPLLVVRLNGTGAATVDDWPAILPHGSARRLLRAAGYGDPLPDGDDHAVRVTAYPRGLGVECTTCARPLGAIRPGDTLAALRGLAAAHRVYCTPDLLGAAA